MLKDILENPIERKYIRGYTSCLETIRNVRSRPLVLFGAGGYGQKILASLKSDGILPQYFCDNNRKKWETIIDGIPVISPKRMTCLNRPLVLISSVFQIELSAQLEGLGIQDYLACDALDFTLKTNGRHYSERLIYENRQSIASFHSKLKDELSRKTLENVINFRLSGDLGYLSHIRDVNIYFPEVIKLNETEIFIDVGAFDGDVIESFFQRINSPTCVVYAFEPETESCKLLRGKYNDDARVFISNDILYDRKCFVAFSRDPNGMGSFVISSSDFKNDIHSVAAHSLDEQLPVLKGSAYLKMDAEGAELAILRGAESFINMVRPKLAISVYHKPADLWELPQFVDALDLNYDFYLRHYSQSISDTVVFAVPKKNYLTN